MRREVFTALSAIAFIATTSACTPVADSPPGPNGAPGEHTDWVQYPTTSAGGDGAAISGVIARKNGCLALRSDEQDEDPGITLAFSASDTRPASLKEGDRFSGAGGEIMFSNEDDRHDFSFPESCKEVSSIIVVAPAN